MLHEIYFFFSLRAKYGQRSFMNAVHGSSSLDMTKKYVDLNRKSVRIYSVIKYFLGNMVSALSPYVIEKK